MRLRQRDLKPYAVKRREVVKDPDGTTYDGWVDQTIIKANVQPAGGKLMSEMYGERLAYMLVGYVENTTDVLRLTEDFNTEKEVFGMCIYSQDADYRIVAIRPWDAHKVIDLEKVRT